MEYNKERKAEAHAKAVENGINYLLSLPPKKRVWDRAVQMVKLPIKLRELDVLPPLDIIRL